MAFAKSSGLAFVSYMESILSFWPRLVAKLDALQKLGYLAFATFATDALLQGVDSRSIPKAV